MKKFPKRTRYKKIMDSVYNFFINEDITEFPFDPLAIIDKNKWGRITYSEIADENNMTIEEVIKGCQSEDGYTIWDGYNYTIAYNDTITVPGRIRFTIMHEIGHIYLNHLIDFDETVLRRGDLTEGKYKVLEREAHAFARNSLAPPSIVNRIKAKNGDSIKEYLMYYFKISKKAAETRLGFLTWDSIKALRYSVFFVHRFNNFIHKVIYSLWCSNCGYMFTSESAKHCPVCGSNNLEKGLGDVGMNYTEITLDELNRAIKCPKCENENVIGDYCQICGSYLVNKCTGFNDEPERYSGPWHELEQSCGELLSGDARFCINCGSTSTFYESGLLKSWEDEVDENLNFSKEVATADDPFSDNNEAIDISDDDLPF